MESEITVIRKIRHVGIVTNNLDKLTNFYMALGLTPMGSSAENMKKYFGEDIEVYIQKLEALDGTVIELLYFPDLAHHTSGNNFYDNGISHIAFTVKDIKKLCDKLKMQGGKILTKEIVFDEEGRKIVFCQDIEGNILELVEE